MQFDILIKNGTVVDGSGAAPYKADLRVSGGKIAALAGTLEPHARERVFDASGCLVTPGFIETHNHYDAPMWWTPNLEPMSGYGITTSVNGNCGFTAAPMGDDEEANLEMIRIFSFFEDIPMKPFREKLAWDWKSWPEYKDSMLRHLRFPVNLEFFCGHQSLRLAAMGLAARERAATPAEVATMAAELRKALAAGAIGFSSNTLDYDGEGRPIPSLLADDAEFSALFDVVDEFPGKTVEIIIDTFSRLNGVADMERFERLLEGHKFRFQWAGVPTIDFQQGPLSKLIDMHERFKAEGKPFYTGFTHVPPTTAVSFWNNLSLAQSNNLVWNELVSATTEHEKIAMLRDEKWRARARESWEQMYSFSPFTRPAEVKLEDTETGVGPVGITLADYMQQKGIAHPSDALADWLLDNGFWSTLIVLLNNASDDQIVGLLKDPNALGNISDSGAHGQMLCGIGDHINLMTRYVRDEGKLTIEEAIHNLTGKLAGFFGFDDRGILEIGRNADIAVFNLDEVERRETIKIYDVPDATGGGRTWRYSRPPAPMRLTLVNGTPTFDRNAYTGAFVGTIAGDLPYDGAELAQAAE